MERQLVRMTFQYRGTEERMEFLTKLFNMMLDRVKVPKEWRERVCAYS